MVKRKLKNKKNKMELKSKQSPPNLTYVRLRCPRHYKITITTLQLSEMSLWCKMINV